VRLGIEHKSSNSSSKNESSSSDEHQCQGPGGQQRNDKQDSLLSSVREVVVSGVHVVKGSSAVHLDQTSIKVRRSSVQLHAVLEILFNGSGIVVVLGQEFSHGQTSGLSEQSHVQSEFSGIEQRSVGRDPSSSGGKRVSQRSDLDHVGSVSLISSFSSVSSRVGVASSPLEVDVVSRSNRKITRNKVVLSGGVSLNDVSSLSSDVQVEDSVGGRDTSGSGSDVEHERSILEGSSELRGINSHGVVSVLVFEGRIGGDGRSNSVGVPIDESSLRRVSSGTEIGSGNIVSDSKSAVAVIVSNASQIRLNRESPVVLIGVTSITSVTQKVISGEGCLDAIGSGHSEGRNLGPLKLSTGTISLVIGSSLDSIVHANKSGFDVEGFGFVEITIIHGSGQDSNINPWNGSPIGIIISLFGTFVSESIGIVVLSSVSRSISSQVSIIDPQSFVSLSSGASLIERIWFVHSVCQLSVGKIDGSVGIVGDGIGGNSVSEESGGFGIGVAAHVLEDDVANQLGVDSATMLSSPFNR